MSAYHDGAISGESRSMRRSRVNSRQNSYRYQNSSLASEENQFIRAYNQSPRVSNSFAFPDSNNYKTLNVSKVSERQSLSPGSLKKKTLIEELTEKNEMLRKEVERVQRILNMGDHHKIKKLPEIDGNVIKKQLENAYKQIKMYEIDITKREKLYEHECGYIDKIRRNEKILTQRQEMVKKLQAEISQTKKQSNEYIKLLQDGHIKRQYANKTSRLHKEIKFYETQLKEHQDLTFSDAYNYQQKNKRISQMQNQLVSSGFDRNQVAFMRKQFQSKEQTVRSVSRVSVDVSEDRSKKAFDGLKNQIATLKKMQKDYSKKMEELDAERQQAEFKALQSKIRLEATEKELEELEQQYTILKKNIDPNKLKPIIKQTSFTESSVTQFGKGKGNPLEHRFETVQVGQYNKKSTPFNDRPTIGTKSAYIVQLTLYENRTQFLGFQAVYLIDGSYKKGNLNLLKRENQRFLKNKNTKLQSGDFFKYFECAINQDNIITGFIAVSFNGKSIQAGVFQSFKKQLQLKNREYPCCLYGSYSNDGFQMIGIEKVEPI